MILHVNYLPQPRTAAASGFVATLFTLLEEGWGDPSLLARLRVHLDWVQYRQNFREAVMIRRVSTGRVEASPLAELAIDVRQARPETFREELVRALNELSPEASEVQGRMTLEPFGPCRSSVIWQFNRLFWQHLATWEHAAGHSYEQALPGGKSDANHPDAVADSVAEFWALLEDLEARNQLPPEIFVLEIGVGSGTRAGLWLNRFKALDVERGSGYYPRVRFLLSDYSLPILDRAEAAVRSHRDVISLVPLDALNPYKTLSFLRYKILQVHLTNVYDNLPTDELVRRGGRFYLVEARAYFPLEDARRISETFDIPVDDLPRTVAKFLEVGPDYFADRARGVAFWQAAWAAIRLEERLVGFDDLPDPPLPAGLDFAHLEDLLQEAPGDIRLHLSSGAVESFLNTLPLLHTRGFLQVQDIFVTSFEQYRQGFRGPGKLDGSVLNWVNGALLREVGARAGYDVHFLPFRYREGSLTSILYTTQRE
jgi:hypothetical protein